MNISVRASNRQAGLDSPRDVPRSHVTHHPTSAAHGIDGSLAPETISYDLNCSYLEAVVSLISGA
jgi:hypothetical protein